MKPQVRKCLAILAWVLPLLLTAIAYRTSPGFDLVGDAVFLIQDNAFMREWSDLWGLVTHGYFWASSGEVIGYWRPITKASWLVETLAGGGAPAVFHLVQVSWFLIGIAGVQALGRDLGLRPVQAMCAALLVGLHPAVIEAVCLVMARSDVVAMAAMTWAVLFWRIGWRTGRVRWTVLHLIAMAVALGSKEVAVVTPVIFGLFWAAERGGRRGWRRSLLALAPGVVLVLAYLVTRGLVLGDSAGARIVLDPFRLFSTGGVYLSGLLPFRVTTGIRNLPVAEAAATGSILWRAAAWAAALGIVVGLAVRRREALPLVGWMALVMAPVLLVDAIHVPNIDEKFPLADRWLFHAVVPVSLLLLHLAAGLRPWPGRILAGALALWVVVSLAMSGETHHWYRDARSLMARDEADYQATPAAFRTHQDRCMHFERQLLVELWEAGDAPVDDLEARLREGRVELQCEEGVDLHFNLASHHVRAGQYERARPLLRRLLDGGPLGREEAMTRLLAGIVEAHVGDPELGLVLLAGARDLGLEDCRIPLEEAQAHRRAGRPLPAARAFEAAYQCRVDQDGVRDPNLLFAAVLLHTRAGTDAPALTALVDELDGLSMEPGLRVAFDAWRRSPSP
ncbi:MAG: hypothetical protein ABIK09_16740 [Pseudomonadota bacterium]